MDPSWLVHGYQDVLKKTQKSFFWIVFQILQTTFVSLPYILLLMAPLSTMKRSLCLLAIATVAQAAPTPGKTNNGCRFMPTDAGWPSAKTWTALNTSVHGQLIATVPIAAPCHDGIAPAGGLSRDWPKYDEQKCTELQDRWLEPELQYVP